MIVLMSGKLENAEYRVSKTAWLDDDMQADTERMVRRVNRRMEDATELSHENAELQQVYYLVYSIFYDVSIQY